MRITLNGERSEISIQRSILPEHWNYRRGCAKPGSAFEAELNDYLEQLRHQIFVHQHELRDKNKPVTAVTLKDAYLNTGTDEYRYNLQVYKELL